MPQTLLDRLKQIREELAQNQITIARLAELRREMRQAFDDKIEHLLDRQSFIRKIQFPRRSLKLWKHRGSHVEIPINLRWVISIPFIYGMIFPATLFHLGIEIYHQTCFRLYGIPLVDRREYFIYDRQLLSWLNWWEKINCIYCSYVNNLIRYSSEIGGRTERYWCPIKYYRRIDNAHSQYPKFVGGKDPKNLRREWEELRNFKDLD